MNANKKKSKSWFLCLLVLLLIIPLIVLSVKRMEGNPPTLTLEMPSSYIGASQTLSVNVGDKQTGIRRVWVAVFKDGKEIVLMDKQFPAANILMGGAIRDQSIDLPIESKSLGLKDGKAIVRMMVRDYAWRKWGKGNQKYQEHEVTIDTRAPSIDVVSPALYLAQGGAGVVIYTLSEKCSASGVMVGDEFYPGYGGSFKVPLTHVAMIALNHKQGKDTKLTVTATDLAGNQGRIGVSRHIKAKKFKKDKIKLSDNFLNWKMPEFSNQIEMTQGASIIDAFLRVNSGLRQKNYEKIVEITSRSDNQIYWKGAFARLSGAANRAGYADFRKYLYNGKTVDKQTHLGIDLASLQKSLVPAANNGKVAFADNLGIYGRTIIIDHGFGLFSLYAHLSKIDVTAEQMVAKGDIIGATGKTGLAGGDHLHYSMLVHQTFINPIEWWDASWIKNNIVSKIELAQ